MADRQLRARAVASLEKTGDACQNLTSIGRTVAGMTPLRIPEGNPGSHLAATGEPLAHATDIRVFCGGLR
ncbi:hypothetical protein EAD89_20675 [Micromonospora sp. BL4]|uniref:hypothetical protein n=1 Tax=Micromonospora sp. BL4 TaxID=2478710 RepID=UPI000EF588C6|nr:hypothetical protein [Micromonospora sp. BL4]RLP86715.1 hypothetical protein EAD89_20675 [Micromonospora sp. BL4]